MTRDAHAGLVELIAICGEEHVGEFLCEVGLHLVAFIKGRLGGVNVEAGGLAKVVGVLFAGEVEASWGGVGEQEGDVVLGGGVLEEALFGGVVGGAGQAGEVDE